jgi:hypothetical protein
MLLFDMLRAQCQHADLSSDIRTPPIWSSTISEVDLITKNSQIDWQECNNWTGKRSWHLEQMVAWCCLGPSTLLLLGVEEVVVTWAYSVALVCLLLFVSKRFVNEIIK